MKLRISDCGLRIGKLAVALFIVFGLDAIAVAGQDQQIEQKLAALEKIQGRFAFVVLGDNRTGDDIYKKVISMAMERKPDFIINTGDQIPTPGSMSDWAKFWEMSRPVAVPYFITVGNHDVHGSQTERTYKEQVDLPGNELYYSFTVGNSLFIVLDSYLDDQEKKITGEQYKWLEAVLANSKQKHKFVFLHHPLYPDKDKGSHYGDSLDKHPQDRNRLQTLFVKNKVPIVFTGHDHLYLRKTVDGIQHIIAGGGGAPLYAKEKDGGFYHYILVTVDGDKVSAEVMDINGKIRDKF